MTQQPAGYDDLDAQLDKLAAAGLLHTIDRLIDKDREMHPLVRWQYRGGIPESRRKAFLFTNPTDAKGRRYPDARVAIGVFAATPEVYALGLGRKREDIGQALGCGAHLSALRRLATGRFDESQCITLERLEAMDEGARLACLLAPDALLQDHEPITLDREEAGRFLSGLRRRGPWGDAEHVAVYGQSPRSLLGTAHVKAGELIPTRLLSPIEIQQILQATPALAAEPH